MLLPANWPTDIFNSESFTYSYSRCSCEEGQTGPTCDILVDKCQSNPCQNSATCVSGSTGYLCHCLYPWSGTHCEIDTDPCYPNPCLYGGTCLEDERTTLGYQCKCGSGFIGQSYLHLNTFCQAEYCVSRSIFKLAKRSIIVCILPTPGD